MLLARALPALLFLAAAAAPSPGAVGVAPPAAPDLTKIDRTIAGEPPYRNTPKYCLLVFGPEAKTRVWLVLDGDMLYVQRNGEGVWVTRRGHSFLLGDVHEVGGKARHTALTFINHGAWQSLSVRLEGREEQTAGWDRRGKLQFAARPQDAPVVHFNGPMTMELFRIQHPLRSNRRVRLSAVVGTPGGGPGTFATLGCDSFLDSATPIGDVVYPGKDEAGNPVVQRVRLCND
jgi:hypothetical protein